MDDISNRHCSCTLPLAGLCTSTLQFVHYEQACSCSIIVQQCRVDNEGDYVLENTNTGARASLYFTPCGWFSSGRYEVRNKAQIELRTTAAKDDSCWAGLL
jgi:hypothetical protein